MARWRNRSNVGASASIVAISNTFCAVMAPASRRWPFWSSAACRILVMIESDGTVGVGSRRPARCRLATSPTRTRARSLHDADALLDGLAIATAIVRAGWYAARPMANGVAAVAIAVVWEGEVSASEPPPPGPPASRWAPKARPPTAGHRAGRRAWGRADPGAPGGEARGMSRGRRPRAVDGYAAARPPAPPPSPRIARIAHLAQI
jgi:hypothetical protein